MYFQGNFLRVAGVTYFTSKYFVLLMNLANMYFQNSDTFDLFLAILTILNNLRSLKTCTYAFFKYVFSIW